jgi:hypothetical protein
VIVWVQVPPRLLKSSRQPAVGGKDRQSPLCRLSPADDPRTQGTMVPWSSGDDAWPTPRERWFDSIRDHCLMGCWSKGKTPTSHVGNRGSIPRRSSAVKSTHDVIGSVSGFQPEGAGSTPAGCSGFRAPCQELTNSRGFESHHSVRNVAEWLKAQTSGVCSVVERFCDLYGSQIQDVGKQVIRRFREPESVGSIPTVLTENGDTGEWDHHGSVEPVRLARGFDSSYLH